MMVEAATRPRRLWLARLAVAALGVLLPILALEASLRLFGPFLPGNYDTGTFLVRHETLGHFHKPNFDGWIKTSEFVTRVQISPLGLRDPRTSYAKPPGAYRILLLGDSFLEAAQVAADQTVAAQLEARLNAGDRRVEVLNAGVAGYGTVQQLLFLEQEGLRYAPDLVVLLFFPGNDLANNNSRLELPNADLRLALKPYFELDADGGLRLIPPPPLAARGGPVHQLRERLVLFNILETGVMLKLDPDWRREWTGGIGELQQPVRGLYDIEPSGEWTRAWQITERLLARLRDRAAEAGAPLVVVGVADWIAFDRVTWNRRALPSRGPRDRATVEAPMAHLGQVSSRLGVPYLDLLPVFRAAESRGVGPLHYPLDKHWTATGHAVAAEAIARALHAWGHAGR